MTRIKFIVYGTMFMSSMNCAVFADQDMSDIQKRFNAGVLSKPFSVPSDAALNAALKEATQRGTPSRQSKGYPGGCVGLGCVWGQNFGYGSYLGGYARPYFGGVYGVNAYNPYYSGGNSPAKH